MGEILNGTASWTDPTLLATEWYPGEADTPEERLRYYADHFPLVEVDSSYYSMPSERNSILWIERTPDHFTFDFKAFRLFTGHPTPPRSLPKPIRQALPEGLAAKSNLYLKDVPPELVNEMWDMYRRALMPVHSAGKLGAVFLQYPKWFFFSEANLAQIEAVRAHLPDYQVAVEFRNASWMDERHQRNTLDFLRQNGIAYTAVDEPQGTMASVPPVAAATSDALAVVRFHGRRADTWDKPNVGVTERFKYLYTPEQLEEWVPKIQTLASEARQVHAIMNNCYADYGVRNAAQLQQMLLQAGVPVARA